MSALHQAAAELIGQASERTVRAVLRLLLGDTAPARPPGTARPRTVPTHAPGSRKRRPHDPAWERLRQQVRAAMRERDLDFAGLGAALGRTAATTECMVSSRRAPGSATQAALRAWLDEAPAVASPVAPFRGRGAKPATNGSATTPA